MSQAIGPILATGGLVMARDVLVLREPLDWRVPIATGLAAAGLATAEHLIGRPAVMFSWLVLLTTALVPMGGKPSPVDLIIRKVNGS